MHASTKKAIDGYGCPQCGAWVGKPCVDASGHPVEYTHQERRDKMRAKPLRRPDPKR